MGEEREFAHAEWRQSFFDRTSREPTPSEAWYAALKWQAARQSSSTAGPLLVGYLPAHELERMKSGHDGRLRSAKFGSSRLDGDIPVYTAPQPAPGETPENTEAKLYTRDEVHHCMDEALEAAAGICDRYGLQSDGPAHDIRLLKRKQSAAPQPASEQQAARGLSDDVRSRLEFYAAGYCKSTSATDREAGKAMYALIAAAKPVGMDTGLTDGQLAEIRDLAAEQTDAWAERQETEPSRAQTNAVFVRRILALIAVKGDGHAE